MKSMEQLNKDMEVIKGMIRVNEKALEDLKDNHLEYENPERFRDKVLMLVKEKASLECFYDKIEAEMRLSNTEFEAVTQAIIDRLYLELKYADEKLSRIPDDMLTASQAIERHIIQAKLKGLLHVIMFDHQLVQKVPSIMGTQRTQRYKTTEMHTATPIEEDKEDDIILSECGVDEFLRVEPEIFTDPDVGYIVSPSGKKLLFVNRGQVEAVQQYILSSKCNGGKIVSSELERIFVESADIDEDVNNNDCGQDKEETIQEIYQILNALNSDKFIPISSIKNLIKALEEYDK